MPIIGRNLHILAQAETARTNSHSTREPNTGNRPLHDLDGLEDQLGASSRTLSNAVTIIGSKAYSEAAQSQDLPGGQASGAGRFLTRAQQPVRSSSSRAETAPTQRSPAPARHRRSGSSTLRRRCSSLRRRRASSAAWSDSGVRGSCSSMRAVAIIRRSASANSNDMGSLPSVAACTRAVISVSAANPSCRRSATRAKRAWR